MNTPHLLCCCTSTLLLAACTLGGKKKDETPQRPNVLFICIDDLRTEVGAYGRSIAKTPNLDAFAEEGSLFFNHYVQVPTSGASRASMLSGRLPRRRSDISNEATVHRMTSQPEGEVPETFYHHLKRNGYYTVGIGKIGHHPDGWVYGLQEPTSDKVELPYSWCEHLYDAGKWETGNNACMGYADGSNRHDLDKNVPPFECGDVESDEGYVDGLTANLAVKKLRDLAEKDQPFCLAVGFLKPHLPFTSPKKYWDLYDREDIPLPEMQGVPEGVNPASLHNSSEFNQYKKGEEVASWKRKVSDAYAKKLRHAYLACVSYADAQVGKLLAELKALGMDKSTVVIIWGDHGWHLGEHNVWGKHTVMETALNSTLMMRVPGRKAGVKNHRIVSSVDIYPTLMELCGIKTPFILDGKSFARLLDNPEDEQWKDVAYSYYKNGISMRTPQYRYTQYFRPAQPNEELFLYDESRYEHKNRIKDFPEIAEGLKPLWEKANTGLYEK